MANGMQLISRRAVVQNPREPLTVRAESGRDERTDRDRQIVDVERQQFAGMVDATLSAAALPMPADRRDRIISSVVEIHHTCARIRENYIDLGRSLLKIYRESPEFYEEITRRGSTFLNLDYTVSIKCRKIAEALEASKISREQLPNTYTVAYEVVTMDAPTLTKAAEMKLLRPDVTRAEIVKFKQRIRDEVKEESDSAGKIAMAIARLEMRRDEIVRRTQIEVGKIDGEIDAFRSRLTSVRPNVASLDFDNTPASTATGDEEDVEGDGAEYSGDAAPAGSDDIKTGQGNGPLALLPRGSEG